MKSRFVEQLQTGITVLAVVVSANGVGFGLSSVEIEPVRQTKRRCVRLGDRKREEIQSRMTSNE